MGVKHAREYGDILNDLMGAIDLIPDHYEFFEMSEEEWNALGNEEKRDVLEALADDVFYGLGVDPLIQVGSAEISHDTKNHIIDVSIGEKIVALVRLT